MKKKLGKKKVGKNSESISTSRTSLHSTGSSTGRQPSTSTARRQTLEKQKVKRKQAQEAKRKIFLNKEQPQPVPSTTITYSFQDATLGFSKAPETLEIHPTKQAPTLAEVDSRMARRKEAEKLKFFGVPIKMYEPDENAAGVVDLTNVKYTEEDALDLRRYGARVIMTKDGRVAAVEVDQDLIKDQLHRKRLHGEICQCTEAEYEISNNLRDDQKVRRIFMIKVLVLELFLRLPALLSVHYQRFNKELHDFLYQQSLLSFLLIAIIQGTRLAGLYYSEIGQYEPCRSIISILVIIGYCLISTLMTSLLEKYSILFIDYKLFDEPTSLSSLYTKRSHESGRKISYPFSFSLMIFYMTFMNLIIIFFLLLPKRVMNELGNAFVLIHIISALLLTMVVGYCIFVVKIKYISPYPLGWDATQILFAWLFTTKWTIWRHYMLQLVVKGRVRKVNEDSYAFIALNYAF